MRWSIWLVLACLAIGVRELAVRPTNVDRPNTEREASGTDGRPTGSESPGSESPSKEAVPKAVVDRSEFDFGLIDMTETCAHTFIIENRGDAPLKLGRGPTTCKCTMSDLPSRAIPPGGKAAVRIASKMENRTGSFSHGAKVLTNDPENEAIELRIRGAIRKFLATKPPRIVLRASNREQSHTERVFLYSEVWDRFRVDAVDSSLRGLQWDVLEADAKASVGPDARGGVELEITLPPNLPGGDFWERMQITIVPEDDPDTKFTTALDLTGSVATRFTLYSEKLREGKVLGLGSVRADRGEKVRLLLKVRDDHRKLTFGTVEAEPRFLQTQVSPKGPAGEKVGLYEISVEVPPNAPPGSYRGNTLGRVRIETDHPSLPLLTIDVDFAVIP